MKNHHVPMVFLWFSMVFLWFSHETTHQIRPRSAQFPAQRPRCPDGRPQQLLPAVGLEHHAVEARQLLKLPDVVVSWENHRKTIGKWWFLMGFDGITLWLCFNSLLWKIAIEVADIPTISMVMFYSYVELPEGMANDTL